MATGIATVLCFLPGILIAFLTSYTLFFIVDQQLEAAEAIQASVKMVWHNFGHALLFFILAAIVPGDRRHRCCVVGLLVAVPGRGVRCGLHLPTPAGSPVVRLMRGRPAPAGSTSVAPASRSASAASVRVQPVTTWSSTSSTGPVGHVALEPEPPGHRGDALGGVHRALPGLRRTGRRSPSGRRPAPRR